MLETIIAIYLAGHATFAIIGVYLVYKFVADQGAQYASGAVMLSIMIVVFPWIVPIAILGAIMVRNIQSKGER